MTRSRFSILRVLAAVACIYSVPHPSIAANEETPERPDVHVQDVIARANQGSPSAQNELGDLYKNGTNVPHDDQKAREWYQKAANQGSAEAEVKLGLMIYVLDFHNQAADREAAEWFRKAADQGNTDAEFYLGDVYGEGRGVPQNLEESAKWLRKAADAGNKNAQSPLGILYFRGLGVPRDVSEAYFWIKLSGTTDKNATVFADEALRMLTPQEIWALNVRIAKWRPAQAGNSGNQESATSAKAADSDAQVSASNQVDLSKSHNPCTKDQAGTVYTFNRGEKPTALIERAEGGNPASQDALASFYEFGLPEDYSEAVKWYKKAAEGGLSRAQNRLGILLSAGLGAQQNNVEAYAWLTVAAAKIPASLIARQSVEKHLTPEEIKRAQDLADTYLKKYGSSLDGCH